MSVESNVAVDGVLPVLQGGAPHGVSACWVLVGGLGYSPSPSLDLAGTGDWTA